MLGRLAAALLLSAGFRGCLVYEYEQEFWLKTDGSGSVYVTGRPALWAAFKGLEGTLDAKASAAALREAARAYFEKAGLSVNRVTLTSRRGRSYLFVSADFDDVNRLSASGAFPDLTIRWRPESGRIRLAGSWVRPPGGGELAEADREGLMAVRFHLPSRVYEHENAADGVERGNILSWRQEVARALAGERLRFGALLDERSILFSTVMLFAGAIAVALLLLGLGFWLAARRGRSAGRAA